MNKHMNQWTNEAIGGMNEQMDRWTNGGMNEQTDGWMDGWMNGWMDGWMNKWMSKWVKRLSEGVSERVWWCIRVESVSQSIIRSNSQSMNQSTNQFMNQSAMSVVVHAGGARGAGHSGGVEPRCMDAGDHHPWYGAPACCGLCSGL